MALARGLVIISLGCSLLAAAGCKRPGDNANQVKSVEAITSGDDSKRHLGDCGDPSVSDRTPEAAVDKVYTRLPQKYRKQFPDLKGRIKLYDETKIADECRKCAKGDARLEQRSKNLSACWCVDLGDATGTALVPDILVTRNRNLVHRDLLAMVSYSVLELYIDKVGDALDNLDEKGRKTLVEAIKKSAPGTKIEDLKAFVSTVRADRFALASAVVDDLSSKGQDVALTNFKTMFGVSSNSELKKSSAAGNFFFAELVESYYCSDVSREAIKTNLGSAWVKMQGIAKYLDSP